MPMMLPPILITPILATQPRLTWIGVIDILVVAVLIYQFLMIVRGRRSAHILIGVTMLHETIPTNGVAEWLAVAVSVIAMIVATAVLSRSAARHDAIHEHELADVLTRGEREN